MKWYANLLGRLEKAIANNDKDYALYIVQDSWEAVQCNCLSYETYYKIEEMYNKWKKTWKD